MFCLVDGIYKSDIIGVRHGFSTREGGVSAHAHTATMNLAFGRGDDDATVLENLSIFAHKLGIDEKTVVSVPQIHSREVRAVGAADRGAGYFFDAGFSCDGYVTSERGVALGVKTADCVPILLADEAHGVVGALHAGWRGSTRGIVFAGVEKMLALGAATGNIKAAIGAAIGPCCYEVGEEVFASAAQNLGIEIAKRFITPREESGKYSADLVGLDRELLLCAGVPEENIDVCGHCTACESETFFSHRASGGVRGTMLALISL